MKTVNIIWSVVLLINFLSCSSDSYKILAFFPFPSNSHHNIFFAVIEALAKNGHEVTYYTPIVPAVKHPNIKLKLTPNYKNEFLKDMDIIRLGQITIPHMSDVISRSAITFENHYYGNPVAQEIIHSNDTYDAVIMESFFAQEPVSALIHKFGCVGIELSTLGDSAWINEWAGVPHNPAYQVDFKVELGDDMTLSERLYNIYTIASTLLVSYHHLDRMQKTTDKFFNYSGWESRPPLRTLLANRSIILINGDPVLNYPYPTAPHLKNIAGVNLRKNKPLPKELQKLMDDSKNGVIYLSLGSNLNTSDVLNGSVGEALMSAFRQLPQTVLIKWENPNSVAFPPNVRTAKWFPQNDILAHKNCVLFITHGGFLSVTEAVYYGVPLVGIPFFSDQFKNIYQAQREGYGLMMKYEDINSSLVHWALEEVINNPKYRKEAQRRSQMLRYRRHTPQEEAVYWVEHAIKFPNSLTPRSAFMSFWEKRIFDVGTFFILVINIVLMISVLFCLCRRRPEHVPSKMKVS